MEDMTNEEYKKLIIGQLADLHTTNFVSKLVEMINKEIYEVQGTIRNEKLVVLGSDTAEQAFIHECNIECYNRYRENLNTICSAINNIEFK